jgi:hypothetical protein
VLSGRGLCVGLITRPEVSECGVSECDHQTLVMRSLGHKGLLCHWEKEWEKFRL